MKSAHHSASAPGKLILVGEHAVVYGRPALAVPLDGIRAQVSVRSNRERTGIIFDAPTLRRRWTLDKRPNDTLSLLTGEVLLAIGVPANQQLHLRITSRIPIASGMGSGAAVATALVRAVAAYFGHMLPNDQISALVYENERRLHGTPSGLDNAVIAFERPVWFVRSDQAPSLQPLAIAAPLTVLIGDTGVRSATKLPVGDLRRRWQHDQAHYETLFDAVGEIATAARTALAAGDLAALGALLNHNHTLLQQLGVSSPELDRLVLAAQTAGALGAKLSGAGWGGIMCALVSPNNAANVQEALLAAGASRVIASTVAKQQPSDSHFLT